MRGRRKLPVGELPKLFDLGVSRSQSGCRQRYVDVYTKFRSGRCARFGSAASLIYKTAALSPTELDDKVEIAVGNSEATLAAHQSSFGWRCTTRVLVIMNRPAGLSSRLQPRTRRGPGRACVRASAGVGSQSSHAHMPGCCCYLRCRHLRKTCRRHRRRCLWRRQYC